jgi:hypothetical protein
VQELKAYNISKDRIDSPLLNHLVLLSVFLYHFKALHFYLSLLFHIYIYIKFNKGLGIKNVFSIILNILFYLLYIVFIFYIFLILIMIYDNYVFIYIFKFC